MPDNMRQRAILSMRSHPESRGGHDEAILRNDEVRGSIPLTSTTHLQ